MTVATAVRSAVRTVARPESAGKLDVTSLRPTLMRAVPLLVGVGLLMLGNGMTSTLLGIRAGLEGFGQTVTGLVLSAYYVGFIVGSLASPSAIQGVGHIRAFAGLGSLASAAVLIHVLRADPLAWFVLRFVSGLCIASLFVVTETWLNGAATNATRGRILSAYMIVVTAGVGGGQLLLTVASADGFGAFVVASVLVSLAVVPVSLSPVTAPVVPEPTPLSLRQTVRTAPLAVVGAVAAGFVGAAVVGAGAIYTAAVGLSAEATAVLIATVLGFALLSQLPLGLLADRTDRRRVIVGLSVAATAASAAAAVVGPSPFAGLLLCAGVSGGLSFPLYLLSNTHLNDYLTSGEVASAGARMVLVNGAGAVAGPFLGGLVIEVAGAERFFVMVGVAYGAVAAYGAWRLTRRAAVPERQRSPLVMMPPGAGPTALALAGHGWEELPGNEGSLLSVDGTRLWWWEKGQGPAVVLVHDAGSSSDHWDEVALSVAAAGYRVVAWDLRGHGRSGPTGTAGAADHLGDLGALLGARDIPSATLVGHGAGAGLAARFAADHHDRVDAVVLVGVGDVLDGSRRAHATVVGTAIDGAARVLKALPLPPSTRGRLSRARQRFRPPAVGPGRRRPAAQPTEQVAGGPADGPGPAPDPMAELRESVRQAIGPDLVRELVAPSLHIRGEHGPAATGVDDQVVLEGCGSDVPGERPRELSDLIVEFLRQGPKRVRVQESHQHPAP